MTDSGPRPSRAVTLVAAAVLAAAATPASAVFELAGPTARGAGLGGAGAAIIRDGTALFYDPAGLANLEGTDVGFVHNRIGGLEFLRYNLAWGGLDLGKWGGVAAGIRAFGTDDPTGRNLSSETTVSVAWGAPVLEDVHSSLSLGATAHLYMLDYGQSAGIYDAGSDTYVGGVDLGYDSTVGVDVAARAELEGRTSVAVVLRNANRPALGRKKSIQLNETLILAGAYEPYAGVSTTVELEMESGREPATFRAGLEYAPAESFVLRAGTGSDPVSLSGGFQLGLDWIQVDYAYGSHPVLPGSHVVGVRVAF